MTSTADTTTTPSGAVVVGVDGSEHGVRALAEAVAIARMEHRPLHLLHARDPEYWLSFPDPSGYSVEALEQASLTQGNDVLAEAAARVGAEPEPPAVTTELIVADPREALLEAAKVASCLVIGSRGRGQIRSMTLGSVGVHVSQHASCPVLICRPPRAGATPAGVAVGVDGSQVSSAALAFAYVQASLRQEPLTIVHCWRTSSRAVTGSAGQPTTSWSTCPAGGAPSPSPWPDSRRPIPASRRTSRSSVTVPTCS
jgi:nucleotide-binding universal stress UspA family protein